MKFSLNDYIWDKIASDYLEYVQIEYLDVNVDENKMNGQTTFSRDRCTAEELLNEMSRMNSNRNG